MSGVTNGDLQNGISFIKRAETIIAAIITAILFWVGTSVSDMRIQIAGMEKDLQHIRTVQETEVDAIRQEVATLKYNLSTVWPRLRNTQSDVKVLWREVERMSKSSIGTPATGSFADPGDKPSASQ